MINKIQLTIVCAIALTSFTGAVVAESSDPEVIPFSNEQKSLSQIEILAFEKRDTSVTKPAIQEPAQNHTKSNVIDSDNYNSVPVDWYSIY